MRPLNLASQPLRNDRLPTLVLTVALLGLGASTVRHAFEARDLLPERTAMVDGELVALEQEVARLRSETERLTTRDAPAETLAEWAVVRDLVDQRAFSWSALLGHLEKVVPPDVRLVSIAPGVTQGRLQVQLSAVGRSVEDGLRFLKALQASPHFDSPFLESVSDGRDGVDLAFTFDYANEVADPGGDAG